MFRELVYLRRSAFKPDMEMHTDRDRHSEWSFPSLFLQRLCHFRYELLISRPRVQPSFRLRIEFKMEKNPISLAVAISKQLRFSGTSKLASAELFHVFSGSFIVSQVWCGRRRNSLERDPSLYLAQPTSCSVRMPNRLNAWRFEVGLLMNEEQSSETVSKQSPARVGVILADLGKLNLSALKYLIGHLNTLEHSIEFELLAPNSNDPFLVALSHEKVAD